MSWTIRGISDSRLHSALPNACLWNLQAFSTIENSPSNDLSELTLAERELWPVGSRHHLPSPRCRPPPTSCHKSSSMICDICDDLLRPHPRRSSRENAKTAQLSQNPQPLHPIRSRLENCCVRLSPSPPSPRIQRTQFSATFARQPHHSSPTT